MTVEADIVAALSGLVGGRAYFKEGPSPLFPRLIINQIGGVKIKYLHGVANKKNGRFQVNTFANSYAECISIARSVEDILEKSESLKADVLGGHLPADAPAGIFGVSQDFSIWFDA